MDALARVARGVAVAMALVLGACSSSADFDRAKEGVERFHEMFNGGTFDAIYSEAGKEFQASTPRDEFLQFVEAVHRKLGKAGEAKLRGWNVNYNTSGSYVTLTYATHYDEGDASEQFVFNVGGGKASLVGFHINSKVLILK